MESEQKLASNSNMSSEDDTTVVKTPPSYVFIRNKRTRETNSPSAFENFKDEMKELFQSFTTIQQKELKEITLKLQGIQQSNSNIEGSIALLTSQNEEFRKKIDDLEVKSKKDREYIVLLEDKVEDLQRQSRKNCVEIKNVPKKTHEDRDDLINMVLCLSKTVDVKMEARDINDVFRLKGRKEGDKTSTSTIIVELNSFISKNNLLKKTKAFNIKTKNKLQAKHLGHTTNEDTPVFISEQLTQKGARLHFLARDLVKSKKFKYCWTSFGRVLVRKDDTSRVIVINNESQVHHLLQDS